MTAIVGSVSVYFYAHVFVSRLKFTITKLQFQNNMRNLSLRQRNLRQPFLVFCKTLNRQLCHLLLHHMAGPTHEYHCVFKEMQAVAEVEYVLQAKFGHRSCKSAIEMTNATIADVENQVSDACVDKCRLLVADRAKIDGALPTEVMLKYGLGNVVELQIPMFREVDDQWTSSKVSMILHTCWIIDTVVLDILACTAIGAISQAVHHPS